MEFRYSQGRAERCGQHSPGRGCWSGQMEYSKKNQKSKKMGTKADKEADKEKR